LRPHIVSKHLLEARWLSAETTDEENALQLELYYKYLHAQAKGFDGDFEAYVSQEIAQPVMDSMIPEDEANEEVPSSHTKQVTSLVFCLIDMCLGISDIPSSRPFQ